MSIRVLSDETINKIAAGEVVENPASVVKELVENAIDAKATSITIEIKGGGFFLIRVTDDGVGMSRDDLLLCLERHATSKIRSAEDLSEIHSMGFRGEALASIAAVSKVRILSCMEEGRVGGELSCFGGRLGKLQDAARTRGTTIEVSSLFYNVPARKKFQKTPAASKAEILKILTKIALAHPECTFKCYSDEKEVLTSHQGTLEETCIAVLGVGFLKGSSPVSFEKNRCVLKGHVGSPLEGRKNRLGQYLIVNGRAVICPEITRSIYEAYGTRLGSQEHPIFALHLNLPPEWIDVNVHPQKREIRLREQGVVHEVVREGVLRALQGKPKEMKPLPKFEPCDWSFVPPFRFQEPQALDNPSLSFDIPGKELPIIGQFDHFLFLDGRGVEFHLPQEAPPYDGVILVDLEAAYARLLFERLLSPDGKKLQGLMIPLTLEFSPHEREKLHLHLKEIETMGIEMRLFGENCFIVDALSPEIEESSVKPLLHELLEVFDQKAPEKEIQKKLALTVSRYARSQKKGWTLLEVKHVVKQLLKSDSPYLCPQGKPTFVHLSYGSITQLFQKAR